MTNMTYNFSWDTEPSDAQLEALMREVGEDVRERRAAADAKFWQALHNEIQQIDREKP
jgi:hypothetical protein